MTNKKALSTNEIVLVSLIVLILAAISIPMMVKAVKTKGIVTQVEKAYSSLDSAFYLIRIIEGSPECWSASEEGYYNVFSAYMPIEREFVPKKLEVVKYKGINGKIEESFNRNNIAMGRMPDGTVIRFVNIDSACKMVCGQSWRLLNVCAEVYVTVRDTNGHINLSNLVFGRNTFAFYITKEGIVPVGTKGSSKDAQYMCNKKSDSIDSKSCTAWILLKKNFNYLKKPVQW